MQYINPYDLLNISATNISEIDSARIRKAKAALFLQIDLSFNDSSAIGQINYKGISLTKADCIKIIDELDNSNKKEFNFFIYLNKHLNNFLSAGDVMFFTEYKIESIYNLPEFVDFISPYFSDQYNLVLTKYFKAGNLDLSSKILNVKPPVNKLYHDKCFNGIRLFLNDIVESLKIARDRIYDDNKLAGSDLFDVIFNRIKKIDPKMINLLPYSDFQNSRNSLADSIKSFAIVVHNAELELPDHEKKNFSNSLKIIEIAKSIYCEGLEEQKIRENYFIIKKNVENFGERVNLEKANPGIKLFSQLSEQLIIKIEEIENKKITLKICASG